MTRVKEQMRGENQSCEAAQDWRKNKHEDGTIGIFLKLVKVNPYDTERPRGNMDRKRLEEEIWRGQSNSTEGRMFVLHVAFFSLNPSTQYGPQSLPDVIPEHRARSSTGRGCPPPKKK